MDKWIIKPLSWTGTPLDLYAKFYLEDNSFFLFSSLTSSENARFSYLSCDPVTTITAKQNRIVVKKDGQEKRSEGNVFQALESCLTERHPYDVFDTHPLPPHIFSGGAVGYFGYDLKDQLEELASTSQDDPERPDAFWMLYDAFVVYDHEKDHYHLCGTKERIDRLEKIIFSDPVIPNDGSRSLDYDINPVVSKEEYIRKIQTIREYIANGDVYEINLAQRFNIRFHKRDRWTDYHIFKSLVETSPSPFSAILKFGENSVISSSPERFLRVRDNDLQSKPIKGTRPRRNDFFEDEAMYFDLLHSEKDRAENVMIVDLVRNDLGRVSETGSVRVDDLFSIEKYATVFQMVSTVTGRLEAGRRPMEAVKACFPPGSMTGAPKIRAMEIIEELEEYKRGVYSGVLGYMGYKGDVELSVIIRTLILKGQEGYFQTGGAIVWDSDPEKEYQECLDKTRGIVNALDKLRT